MSNQDYIKKKKFRENFKKAVMNIFIWLIIISFVSTIGVYWGNKINVDVIKVATINNTDYTYQPGSSFAYIFENTRNNLSKRLKYYESHNLNKIAVNQASQILLTYGLIYDLAKKIKLQPSKEAIKYLLDYMTGGGIPTAPTKGLLEYLNMEYANMAISGENGDIMNSITPVTVAELYSYFDLVNFTVVAEFLYLNITNYLMEKLSYEELNPYYLSNLYKYSSEIYVYDISVSNKTTAHEINKYMKEKGWDDGLLQFKNKYIDNGIITLSDKPGLSKRFNIAIKLDKNSITEKPQFENGEYHIFKVVNFQEITKLNTNIIQNIRRDYLLENYTNLKSKYKNEIDEIIKSVELNLVKEKNFENLAKITKLKYAKSGQISPINRLLKDNQQNVLDLPVLDNKDIFEFLFTAGKNQISQIYNTNDYIILVKVIYKGDNPNIVYENIDQEIYLRYLNFKTSSISKDWIDNLKSTVRNVIYKENLTNLY